MIEKSRGLTIITGFISSVRTTEDFHIFPYYNSLRIAGQSVSFRTPFPLHIDIGDVVSICFYKGGWLFKNEVVGYANHNTSDFYKLGVFALKPLVIFSVILVFLIKFITDFFPTYVQKLGYVFKDKFHKHIVDPSVFQIYEMYQKTKYVDVNLIKAGASFVGSVLIIMILWHIYGYCIRRYFARRRAKKIVSQYYSIMNSYCEEYDGDAIEMDDNKLNQILKGEFY